MPNTWKMIFTNPLARFTIPILSGRQYGMPEIDDADLEAELDALGDDLMMDDDMSYLDAAAEAPTNVPGGSSQKDEGATLDEFGLPALS